VTSPEEAQAALVQAFGGGSAAVGGRGRWLGIGVVGALLGGLELVVVAVLAHAVLPAPIARVLDVLGVVALVAVIAAVASVLRRRHRLDDRGALLVLGFLAGIVVPLQAVSAVEPLPPLQPVDVDGVGPSYADGRLVLTAATDVPRVRVALREPVRGRELWRHHEVTEIVVSVARPPAG